MATLSEIAKRAGVSVSTVSLALRGRGPLARETVEKVKAVASELDYRPNPLLSSLASKKFRSPSTVAGTSLAIFIFPNNATGTRVSTYEKSMREGAQELGYSPTIYRIDDRTCPDTVFRELYHRMVQGILVLGGLSENSFFQQFDWAQFSVVQCGRYFGPQPFHVVRPNIFQAVKLAFQELQRLGYKRIGYAVGRHPQQMEDDDARYGAALAMEAALVSPKNRIPVFTGQHNDLEAIADWAKRHRPDVIIGFSEGVYWNLCDLGFVIPRDWGFATMHAGGIRHPSGLLCSGTQQNQTMIARQSVMLLDQLIRNRERGFPQSCLDVLVRSTWVEGNTTIDTTASAHAPPISPQTRSRRRAVL